MKRSEVITRIQVLLESVGYIGNHDDGEKVLSLLESMGMLPPQRKLEGDELSLKNQQLLSHGIDNRPLTNSWEPEDEEK